MQKKNWWFIYFCAVFWQLFMFLKKIVLDRWIPSSTSKFNPKDIESWCLFGLNFEDKGAKLARFLGWKTRLDNNQCYRRIVLKEECLYTYVRKSQNNFFLSSIIQKKIPIFLLKEHLLNESHKAIRLPAAKSHWVLIESKIFTWSWKPKCWVNSRAVAQYGGLSLRCHCISRYQNPTDLRKDLQM